MSTTALSTAHIPKERLDRKRYEKGAEVFEMPDKNKIIRYEESQSEVTEGEEGERKRGREGEREGVREGIREIREGISEGIREGEREGIREGGREGGEATVPRSKQKVVDAEQDVYRSYREIWTEVPEIGDPLKLLKSWRHFLAEMIGTALLVFFGTGAAISSIPLHGLNAAAIMTTSASFGLVVAALIYALGNVSGGHLNPAVTMGFLVTMKIPIIKGLLYIGFQCVGAIIGSALVFGVFPYNVAQHMKFGANSVNIAGTWTPDRGRTWDVYTVSTGSAILVESTLTFTLMITVLLTAQIPKSSADRGDFAPLAIGFVVFIAHLVAIPLTGTSINPARSLGPAVFSHYWTDHWVWWVGPFVGAILGGLVYKYLFITPIMNRKTPLQS